MKTKTKDSKIEFAKLLRKSGCSNKVIDELFKWYDYS